MTRFVPRLRPHLVRRAASAQPCWPAGLSLLFTALVTLLLSVAAQPAHAARRPAGGVEAVGCAVAVSTLPAQTRAEQLTIARASEIGDIDDDADGEGDDQAPVEAGARLWPSLALPSRPTRAALPVDTLALSTPERRPTPAAGRSPGTIRGPPSSR